MLSSCKTRQCCIARYILKTARRDNFIVPLQLHQLHLLEELRPQEVRGAGTAKPLAQRRRRRRNGGEIYRRAEAALRVGGMGNGARNAARWAPGPRGSEFVQPRDVQTLFYEN